MFTLHSKQIAMTAARLLSSTLLASAADRTQCKHVLQCRCPLLEHNATNWSTKVKLTMTLSVTVILPYRDK